MLSVLRRLLGHAAESNVASPLGKLRSLLWNYRPELVATLRDQHQELLRLFAELERASEQASPGACRLALHRFAQALDRHLAVENRYLYGYLTRKNHADAETTRRVDVMMTDMMHVGRILARFVETHARAAWTSDDIVQLRRDLRVVGEVLAHRIHEEETILYPLYTPSAG